MNDSIIFTGGIQSISFLLWNVNVVLLKLQVVIIYKVKRQPENNDTELFMVIEIRFQPLKYRNRSRFSVIIFSHMSAVLDGRE